MKLAYMLMGHFDSRRDRTDMHGGDVQVVGVSSIEDACQTARQLAADGVRCIELCGAFEEAGARAVIAATGGKVAVSYAVHLPEQDALFEEIFG